RPRSTAAAARAHSRRRTSPQPLGQLSGELPRTARVDDALAEPPPLDDADRRTLRHLEPRHELRMPLHRDAHQLERRVVASPWQDLREIPLHPPASPGPLRIEEDQLRLGRGTYSGNLFQVIRLLRDHYSLTPLADDADREPKLDAADRHRPCPEAEGEEAPVAAAHGRRSLEVSLFEHGCVKVGS